MQRESRRGPIFSNFSTYMIRDGEQKLQLKSWSLLSFTHFLALSGVEKEFLF